jgi:hypothetical protein
VSTGIAVLVALTDVLDEVPAIARPLRFVGLIVSGWAFWRWVLSRAAHA